MSRTYTYRGSLTFSVGGDDQESDLTIRYVVNHGSPPTQEDPGEAPYTEITDAFVIIGAERQYLPDWMIDDFFNADEELRAILLANAAEDDECAADEAADARREELRSERGQ